MKPEMIPFYLNGRGVTRLAKIRSLVADPEEIADEIEKGAELRVAITKACDEAARQFAVHRKRKEKWFEENKAELDEADLSTTIGGKDAAWEAYCKGVGDELAYCLEPDVINALDGDEEGEDEGVDGEDDDEDDDDKLTT
jgi:hypothetical protein